jgi:hypothetical protein
MGIRSSFAFLTAHERLQSTEVYFLAGGWAYDLDATIHLLRPLILVYTLAQTMAIFVFFPRQKLRPYEITISCCISGP